MERDRTAIGGLDSYFQELVLASEIGISHFNSFVFRHSVMEACTAVKAQFLSWMMHRFPQQQNFLFLDPDVRAYSRFEELEAILPESQTFSKCQIIVTPHQLQDEDSDTGIRENTFRTLIAGTFNLGFLGLCRSQAATEFLRWWNRKLMSLCYMEWRGRGLFVDQKWALLGVSYFDMTVLREPGYNVANWNVSMRRLTLSTPGQYLVEGKPLRFFHFSNIDSGRDMYFYHRFLKPDSPVFELREEYLQEVQAFDLSGLSKRGWSYDRFLSGERVASEVRHLYRSNPQIIQMFPEPFTESNSRFFQAAAQIAVRESEKGPCGVPAKTPGTKPQKAVLGASRRLGAIRS